MARYSPGLTADATWRTLVTLLGLVFVSSDSVTSLDRIHSLPSEGFLGRRFWQEFKVPLAPGRMDPLRLHGGGGDTPSGRLTRTDSLDDYSARKLTRSDSVSDGYYRGSATISHASNGYIQMIERSDLMAIDDSKIVLVMVGLPGRGKSFISRKIELYLTWFGENTKVFNVGKYRRQVVDPKDSGRADFYDRSNAEALGLRERAAGLAMNDLLDWLDADGRVAIFDATNSAKSRRRWVWNAVKSRNRRHHVVFIESICDDPKILQDTFNSKVDNSPDFKGMSKEDALAELKKRIANYEASYEEIAGSRVSYIKLYNLSSKVSCNKIYGRLANGLLPFLMAAHIGTRPIWLVRAGASSPDSSANGRLVSKAAELGNDGEVWAQALCKWVTQRSRNWMERHGSRCPALRKARLTINDVYESGDMCLPDQELDEETMAFFKQEDHREAPLMKIFSSTLPRAMNTVSPIGIPFSPYPQLNPMDKGSLSDYSLEQIRNMPEIRETFDKDPFRYRFPGGESFVDVVHRLESVLIEIEQQTAPSLVVGHTSSMKALYSYFAGMKFEDCHNQDFPQHTIVELVPVMGGSWIEQRWALDESRTGLTKVAGPTQLTQAQRA
mmetsp:Transcript_37085/g.87280  ORF Transcript_37085/g.87280 Transcript_37085/m.87280 type:complete len:611 (-) Transcript_37085:84-1916(-)